MADIAALQERWKHLYHDYLPSLAKARDPVQETWPVHLDHCFARIVLDNAIGKDRPWTEVVKQPAVKNMTAKQLEMAIEMAESIATGEAKLVELDDKSLTLRGKSKTKKRRVGESHFEEEQGSPKKQKSTGAISSYFLPSPPLKKSSPENGVAKDSKTEVCDDENAAMAIQIKRIDNSDITPFRKQMLRLLCQVPRGRYSTYKELSDYVTRTSHKTCARACGNAMRNNPFAPEVPCHRILAHDGTLGGFKGDWGENGKFASKKHELLYEEGVRFDSRGKVKGPPFRGFTG